MRAGGLATALGLALAACGLTTERDVPISPKYPLPEQASAECVAAAKRASRWCVTELSISSDAMYSSNCTEAQWDYARYCR